MVTYHDRGQVAEVRTREDEVVELSFPADSVTKSPIHRTVGIEPHNGGSRSGRTAHSTDDDLPAWREQDGQFTSSSSPPKPMV